MPPALTRAASLSTNRGKIPCGVGTARPGGRLLRQLGEAAGLRGHRKLIEQRGGGGGNKRLHEDPEMAQYFSQRIKNRLHPLRITAP